jgi:hypothetical protein
MSRDESKERSSQRRVARPHLPPGPLRDLNDLLHELYLRAEAPRLDYIAKVAEDDDRLKGAPGLLEGRVYLVEPSA